MIKHNIKFYNASTCSPSPIHLQPKVDFLTILPYNLSQAGS
jgi:hypothetical protein